MGGRKREVIEFLWGYPLALLASARLRPAAEKAAMINVQGDTKVGEAVLHLQEAITDLDLEGQLFVKRAAKRLRLRFPQLDPGARKFPQAAEQAFGLALID